MIPRRTIDLAISLILYAILMRINLGNYIITRDIIQLLNLSDTYSIE